jgi:hypothetical protein
MICECRRISLTRQLSGHFFAIRCGRIVILSITFLNSYGIAARSARVIGGVRRRSGEGFDTFLSDPHHMLA